MLKYKLICSDLDDTLVNSEVRLTDRTIDAVRRYVEAGGRFCIVTGRMTVGAIPICKRLGLDTETATFQGAIITDLKSGKTIFEECLDTEEAAEVADYITAKGVYCQTYTGDDFITQKGNEYSVLYGKIIGIKYKEVGMPLGEYIRKNKLRPPKVLIIEKEEKVPEILKDLQEKFGHKFRINTSKPFIIEIISKTMSKAKAVDFIAERNGISLDEVICVGDSENDLPMIEHAGLGVAVGNAKENVKQAADLVVPSCDDDGVAWLIDNVCLK